MKTTGVFLFIILCIICTNTYSQANLTIDNTITYSTPPAFADGVKYTNFTDAITALNAAALNNSYFPIVYHVTAGQTFYEPGLIPPIYQSGNSEEKEVIFRKEGKGENPVIIPAAGADNKDWGIAMDGADYIIFNSIDIRQGTDEERNENNNTRTEFGYYIFNKNKGGAQHNKIINCTIILNRANINTIGIFQQNLVEKSNKENNNSFNRFEKDAVYNSYRGIALKGSADFSDGQYEQGCIINSCVIGEMSTEWGIGCREDIVGEADVCGILLENEGDVLLRNCKIQNAGYFNTETGTFTYGINFINAYGDNNIFNNDIHDIEYRGRAEKKGVCAFQIICSPNSKSTLCNNFIANVFNRDINHYDDLLTSGITAAGNKGVVNIYHNSVYLSYSESAIQSPSALLYVPRDNPIDVYIRNNIFKNYLNSTDPKSFCLYIGNENIVSAAENIYDCKPEGPYFTGFYNGATLQTINEWLTTVTNDHNSMQFDVSFTSATDLHLLLSAVTPDYKATGVPGYIYAMNDIDGYYRTLLRPTKGASERPTDNCLSSYSVITSVDCTLQPPLDPCINGTNACNYIRNSDFDLVGPFNFDCSSPDYVTPAIAFNRGLIKSWYAVQGGPGFNPSSSGCVYTNPPVGNNYAALYVELGNQTNPFFPQENFKVNAGMVQKIPALTPNKKYSFSIFSIPVVQDIVAYPFYGGNPYNGDFDVVLLHCEDQNSIFTVDNPLNAFPGFGLYTTTSPAIPADAQVIVCDKIFPDGTRDINNQDCSNPEFPWKQTAVTFTANDDYNMIWIFPHYKANLQQLRTGSEIDVAYPELIDISNFTAGPPPNTNTSNCIVTIGPVVPNCSVAFAEFTWIPPNGGAPIPVTNPTQSQQIQIDISNPANVGIWRLKMKASSTYNFPSSDLNSCSDNLDVSASVNIGACGSGPCIKLPKVQ